MTFLTDLWLPIVLAAVIVFFASFILHMVVPLHKKDYAKLPNEDAVLAAMRSAGVKPGAYMFPHCESPKDWNTPEAIAKREKGPLGMVTVLNGFNMGKSLVIWFIYSLLVGVFVAYVAWHSLALGATPGAVFRITGAAAILGYALGFLHEMAWKGQSAGVTAKFVFGGIIYALITAGTFAWLWPEAVVA